MKKLSSALKAILASGSFVMEDLYTVTLKSGTEVRMTNGEQPISIAMGVAAEDPVVNDEYSKTIVVDYTKVAADLVNFPVPVIIKDADDPIFTKSRADGFDIWFADDEDNPLDFERAAWDQENHLAVFFVRIPALSSTVDTTFFLYYGDTVSHTEDPSNATDVYDSDCLAVYNFAQVPNPEYPGGTLHDSTVNAKHGTQSTTITAAQRVTGTTGYGWRFNSVNSDCVSLYLPDQPTLLAETPTAVTVEFVFQSDSSTARQALLYWADHAHGIWMHSQLNWDASNEIRHYLRDGVIGFGYGEGATADATHDVTSERYAAFTAVSGSGACIDPATGGAKEGTLKGYVDGVQCGATVGIDKFWGNELTSAYLGTDLTNFFDGVLFLVRFSKVARSADWIKTYENARMSNGTFLAVTDNSAAEEDSSASVTPDETVYTWEPVPMERSEHTWKIGLDVDGTEIKISPRAGDTVEGYSFMDAIRMGLFDMASVRVDRAYWARESATVDPETVELFSGIVGEASAAGVTATLKVEPLTALLDIGMPRNLFQGPCTNMLWDSNCGLDRNDWDVTGTVASGSTAKTIKLAGNAAAKASGWFKLGWVEFTSGDYNGVTRRIKAHSGKKIQLFPPLAATPAAGVTLRLWPGCNRTGKTCTIKFDNFPQFRGCPHIPVAETAA